MPTWPATLPCAPLPGFRVRQEPNIAEFRPDVGRPQRSRRYTNTRYLYSGMIKCTTAQMQQVMAFYEECEVGVLSFTMEDWLPNTNSPPEGVFTFVSPPDFEKSGPNYWFVSLELAKES